ncbi:hypothetical protein BT93_B2099 [Corymbia citriodora subsp. variegata]|nr:hypothetical protein BT93_B2099 [Corymbia citriodora subsp. variegata]
MSATSSLHALIARSATFLGSAERRLDGSLLWSEDQMPAPPSMSRLLRDERRKKMVPRQME